MQEHIPAEEVAQVKLLCKQWTSWGYATHKSLQKLVGHLIYLLKCVCLAHLFVNRILQGPTSWKLVTSKMSTGSANSQKHSMGLPGCTRETHHIYTCMLTPPCRAWVLTHNDTCMNQKYHTATNSDSVYIVSTLK